MKGLGLNCMLVGKLNKLKIGFAKHWLFSLKTQPTNKQSKHITATGFINLQLLQKLSSQKLFWDKARLSSLVNKRFVGYHILYEFIEIMNIYFSYIDFWAVSTNLEGLWLLSSGIFCDLGWPYLLGVDHARPILLGWWQNCVVLAISIGHPWLAHW